MSIERLKELLGDVGMGIAEAHVAMEAVEKEVEVMSARLEKLEAANKHNTEKKEEKVLAQMREVEDGMHPGG